MPLVCLGTISEQIYENSLLVFAFNALASPPPQPNPTHATGSQCVVLQRVKLQEEADECLTRTNRSYHGSISSLNMMLVELLYPALVVIPDVFTGKGITHGR